MRCAQDSLFEQVWAEGLRIVLLSATVGLLLWGWFALTLSPVQSYYFPAYIVSSLHMTNGSEPDQVAWLVKTRPKKQIDFAAAEDLVPTKEGPAPFAISAHAIEQGWREVHALKPISYQGGSQAVMLRDSFFEGRSLYQLLLPPLELLALPVALWAGFVHWRYQRDQERPPAWAWNYEKTSWAEDVNEFSGDIRHAVKDCAVIGWRVGMQAVRFAVRKWRERASVSPSAAAIPEKKMVAVVEPKPATVAAAALPKPQPKIRAVPPSARPPTAAKADHAVELPRAQTLPFRKQQSVPSGEKWDESKWID